MLKNAPRAAMARDSQFGLELKKVGSTLARGSDARAGRARPPDAVPYLWWLPGLPDRRLDRVHRCGGGGFSTPAPWCPWDVSALLARPAGRIPCAGSASAPPPSLHGAQNGAPQKAAQNDAFAAAIMRPLAVLLLLQPVRAVVQSIAGTDTNCSFSLRHGLKKDGRGTPTLRLVYSEGVLEAQPTTDAEIFAQRPRLCWLDRDQTSTKPVLLMVANSLPYLWHEWPYFANKVAFARKSHWKAVLWLGELPKDIATTVGPWCCASAVDAEAWL